MTLGLGKAAAAPATTNKDETKNNFIIQKL